MHTLVCWNTSFDAAHRLPWYEGKCRNLHGHTYRLEVAVGGPIGANGMVLDFADLKRVVRREIIDRYDHTYLNDQLDNPTAEVLAQDIWKRLEASDLAIDRIRLWETEHCMVEVVADRDG